MSIARDKLTIQRLLASAEIEIDGNRPWDIQVNNQAFYSAVIKQPALGLGESYLNGWWDCKRIDELIYRLIKVNPILTLLQQQGLVIKLLQFFTGLSYRLINFQTKRGALTVAKQHYDHGNEFYQALLDPYMNYSCAYWRNALDLISAQLAKLDLICKKLYLEPGMHLLDIGCGWGGLAKYAALHYPIKVTGITISQPQMEYAKQFCANLPIEILLKDYRDIKDSYDRIASIGMFEHVGYKNYRRYMQIAHHVLKSDGLFLLHTIGGNVSTTHSNAWIRKYIFPNSMIPSIKQIGQACEGLFIIEDWHNFGADYDKTLMAWHENFLRYWQTFKDKYDQGFYRIWNYYLLSCAGAFRARSLQLWQIVLSKRGVPSGYTSIR